MMDMFNLLSIYNRENVFKVHIENPSMALCLEIQSRKILRIVFYVLS